MIIDQRHIDFFKKLANDQYVTMILNDYGHDKNEALIYLTDSITNIYKHLPYNSFDTVIIYSALIPNTFLSNLEGANPVSYNSYENLAPLQGKEIVLEIKENGQVYVAINYNLDIAVVRETSIIYKFDNTLSTETIFGKNSEKKLRPIPDADSYFSIQSYKELEVALEDYHTKVARHSECVYLKTAWFDDNRIFFKSKPEHILRDSLTQFLKMRLRNTEVRPEQVVDKSHPVDIKVTWSLASHLALIEIKWMGKSLYQLGKSFKQIYNRQRALDGAEQLVNYLDENKKQSPNKTTKGYLVIFDGRRWGCNSKASQVSQQNGMKYLTDEIIFEPEYHSLRKDFTKPFRFFMQPIYTVIK